MKQVLNNLKNEFLYIYSSNIAWEAYVEAKKKKSFFHRLIINTLANLKD